MSRTFAALPLLFLAGACATAEMEIPQGISAAGDPPRVVAASVESRVGRKVDADDPALWAHPAAPSRALLFGTDKSEGLYVHALDGSVRQFSADGPLNNVDLRGGFQVDGKAHVLVAATERRRFGIMTYLLDPDTLAVRPYGFVPTDMGEPYGFCTGQVGGVTYLIPNNKAGDIRVYRLEAGPQGPVATIVRRMKVDSQPEGCVVDDSTGHLYVGEEDVGIWRFRIGDADGTPPLEIARNDGVRLTSDVEGLALLRDGTGQYLVASSQGDSTFPVWRIDGDRHDYVGRFAVEGGSIPPVRGTDGLDAWSGPIGPYPEGVLAIHNSSAALPDEQNYVLVDWRDVRRALGIGEAAQQ